MNQQIRELAEQARFDSRNEKHYLERVHNREITLDEYQEIYDKKFAELIVRECANVAADHDALDIYEEIREHFGVEE